MTNEPKAVTTAKAWIVLDEEKGMITLGDDLIEIHFEGTEVSVANQRLLVESLAALVDSHTLEVLQQERTMTEQVLRSLLREIVPGLPMIRMTRDLAFNTGIEIALRQLGYEPEKVQVEGVEWNEEKGWHRTDTEGSESNETGG